MPRDVQLVIKMRDEASRAANAVSGALESLLGVQKAVGDGAAHTSGELAELGRAVIALDKAYGTIKNAADTGEAAFNRQQRGIAETRAQLAAVEVQIKGATAALSSLRAASEADGADKSQYAAKIKAVEAALAGLESQQRKLTGSIESQDSQIARSRSSLQELASTANAADAAFAAVGDKSGQAMLRAAAMTEEQTRALREQAAAAREAAQAESSRSRFDTFMGVTPDPKGSTAKASAAFFEEQLGAAQAVADAARDLGLAEERAAAEARRTAEALQDQAAAAREAAQAESSRGRFDTFMGVKPDPKGGVASQSAAVFEESIRLKEADAKATADLEQRTEALIAAIDPLRAIQDRLNKELTEARTLYKAGKISAEELALAEKVLQRNANDAADALNRQGRGERGRVSLFGLKPYELTNLGYQVNDFFTQLASGTSLTQTLAQQGGQILQLFPKLGATVVAALGNPVVLGSAATFGAIFLAIKRVADEEGRVRQFSGTLTAMGDGSRYAAEALSDNAAALDRFGMSAEQAVGIVRAFVKEGLDPALIEAFGRAAQNMADILGEDVVDAAKQIGPAFTGGYEALSRFDDAQNFLTASEREHIRIMFESGRVQEARAEAFRIFSDRMDDAAEKARGPWSDAARSLGQAWGDFLDKLADQKAIKIAAGTITIFGKLISAALKQTDNANQLLEKRQALLERMRRLGNGDLVKGARAAANDPTAQRLVREIEALEKAVQQVDPRAEQAKAVQTARNEATAAIQREREALYAVSDAQRVRLAGEEAYQAEIRKSGDAVIAQARKEFAVEKKREEIRREHAREAERERRRRESQFGSDIAKQRRAQLAETAEGFKGLNENRPGDRDALMALFKKANINVDPKMVAWCAAFVNAVLATNGLPGTGKLNARSFLNFGQETNNPEKGDIAVLKRGKNAAQGHVGFFDSFDSKGNVRITGGNQRDGVSTQTFDKKDVLSFRRAPDIANVYAEAAKAEEQLAKKQDDFNAKIDDENERRRLTIDALTRQKGLTEAALSDEQKRQAVAAAVLAAEQQADKTGLTLDAARRAEIEKTVAAEWDLVHAKEQAAARQHAVEKPVDDLSGQRQALMEQIKFYRDIGKENVASALETQLRDINRQLSDAIANAVAYWMAVAGEDPARGAEARTAIMNLQNLQNTLIATQDEFTFTARQIQDVFAGALTSSVDNFAQQIAEGGNAILALRNLFLGFAADFLREIAMMLLKAAALKLAMKIGFGKMAGDMSSLFNAGSLAAAGGVLSAAGGTLTAAGGSLTGSATMWAVTASQIMAAANMLMAANASGGAGVFHSGGIAGAANRSRAIHPAIFAAAARYHGGGIAGLRPNEVPAILERGEEILTKGDARHRANGGGGGGAPGSNPLKQVLVMNPADIAGAMAGSAGEQVVVTHIRRNRTTLRQELGIGQ